MIRLLAVSLASLLLAAPAWAEPVLRADITVSAPVVNVGDMFDNAGDAANAPLFRSPLPGTSGLVDLATIDAALERAGIASFDAQGLTGTRVSRAAAVVDETVLAALIADDLKQRGILGAGMSVDTLFATAVTPVNAEAVKQPARIVSLRYLPGNGGFTARFAIAGVAQPLDVSGNIELMIEAPHVVGTVAAGTLLSAADVAMRPVPLKYVEASGVPRIEDVVGKTLLRQSRDGMMLRLADVATPLTVGKNDLVTIYFRKGPMTLSVKGQAITGAAAGGQLQVLNLMSKRVISATALSTGAVEVSADPLTLAGL